jgi:hypothetical protein
MVPFASGAQQCLPHAPKNPFIKGLPTPIILHSNTIPINRIFMRFTNNIGIFPKPSTMPYDRPRINDTLVERPAF